MRPGPTKTRRLEARVALVFVALCAGGCEKHLPRENVAPANHQRPSGPSNPGDGDGDGDGFTPTPGDGDMQPGGRDGGGGDPPPMGDGGVVVVPGDDASTPPPRSCTAPVASAEPFSKAGLLESIAQCTTYQLCEVELLTARFAEAAAAHAAAPSESTEEAVKNAWYYAFEAWQINELFRFGPAAPAMEPGGKGMREQIHAFPLVGRCKTDELLSDNKLSAQAVAAAPYNARGFAAAEYLLFYEGTDNGCSSFHRLNGKGEWALMSAAELVLRKRALLSGVAADIHARVTKLVNEWSPSGQNFTETLVSAGHGSTLFASEQAGLNAVSNALFYLDKEVKDWKVATPAGLGACTADCLSQAESLHARIGKNHVRQNLKAARLLLQGCAPGNAGHGFDDWLRAVNMGVVADDLLGALDGADAAMASFDLDAAFRSSDSAQKVAPVHAAIKAVTDILKTDFLSALDLEIPMSAEGDND